MAEMNLYRVHVGGIETVAQFTPDTAARLGLEPYVEPVPGAPRKRAKARTRAEADTVAEADALGVELADPTHGETTPGDLGV